MNDSFTKQFQSDIDYFTVKRGISLLSPANEEDIISAEKILGYIFSPQMRSFLKEFNGGRVLEVTIRGVQSLGFKKIPRRLDIVESNLTLRSFYGWDQSWLEIGQDGFGNYYIVDMSKKLENGEYPVIIADHEAIGEEDAIMDYATGYFEFILKAVGEMKQIYTPTGELQSLKNKNIGLTHP